MNYDPPQKEASRSRKDFRSRRAKNQEPLVIWSLRLPESVDTALKRRAERERRSANNMVAMLLRQALAEDIDRLAEEALVAENEDGA
jgi:hypothetical protein